MIKIIGIHEKFNLELWYKLSFKVLSILLHKLDNFPDYILFKEEYILLLTQFQSFT